MFLLKSCTVVPMVSHLAKKITVATKFTVRTLHAYDETRDTNSWSETSITGLSLLDLITAYFMLTFNRPSMLP